MHCTARYAQPGGAAQSDIYVPQLITATLLGRHSIANGSSSVASERKHLLSIGVRVALSGVHVERRGALGLRWQWWGMLAAAVSACARGGPGCVRGWQRWGEKSQGRA